jgi:hypothetical protein
VNCAVLSLVATSRTPRSPIDMVLRLCVRAMAVSSAFPLVGPLSSTASAHGASPRLFGSFSGTMGPSDFSSAYISDVRLPAFSERPCPPSGQGADEISRFPCKEFPRIHRVSDCARPECDSRVPPHSVLPSAWLDNVGVPDTLISQLNGWAGLRVPLSTLRLPPHGDTRMTRGRCGSLGLHRMTLSFTTPCRF